MQSDDEAGIDDRGAKPAATGADRRLYRRLRPDEVAALSATRLASGAEIKLIDLSRGGAQFETDRRFLPNATVSLRLVARDSAFVVHGRVVRSRIVRLTSGGLGYNVAVAFNELLENVIDELVPPEAVPASDGADSSGTGAMLGHDASPDEQDDASVTPAERAAFEASAPPAAAMMTVTAAVNSSGEELLDMFNGNDW
jgi:hypothetical protein